MKSLYLRIDAMFDRIVEANNFVNGRGRLQPVRLKNILELIRGYITVGAIFFAATAILKANKTLDLSVILLYMIFGVTSFLLMIQSVYMLLTITARATLSLLEPRFAVRLVRLIRSKNRWPKFIVYIVSIILIFIYWKLLSSMLASLVKLAFQL